MPASRLASVIGNDRSLDYFLIGFSSSPDQTDNWRFLETLEVALRHGIERPVCPVERHEELEIARGLGAVEALRAVAVTTNDPIINLIFDLSARIDRAVVDDMKAHTEDRLKEVANLI